jgi:hypothetical protein
MDFSPLWGAKIFAVAWVSRAARRILKPLEPQAAMSTGIYRQPRDRF